MRLSARRILTPAQFVVSTTRLIPADNGASSSSALREPGQTARPESHWYEVPAPTVSRHVAPETQRPETVLDPEALRARAEVECARIQQEAVDTASRQAAEMIERARSEAESLLAQARAEIEAVEREARQRGRQQAQEEVELEMAAELERLAGLLTCAREERLRVMADHESALVDLAVEIAGRLVRAELQLDRQAIVRIAQEALETAATTETLQLHLCPDDAAWLGERMSAAWRAEGVVLVANETIEPGGCLLVTAHGRVDARLGSRLGEIRAALAQELS